MDKKLLLIIKGISTYAQDEQNNPSIYKNIYSKYLF